MSRKSSEEFMARKPFYALSERQKRKRLSLDATRTRRHSVSGCTTACDGNINSITVNDNRIHKVLLENRQQHSTVGSSIDPNLDSGDDSISLSNETNEESEPEGNEHDDFSDFFYDSEDDSESEFPDQEFLPPVEDLENTYDSDFINFEKEQSEGINFLQLIMTWALTYKIKMNALSALLKILKLCSSFSDFPADARTLLKTPLTERAKVMDDGEYYHFGLLKSILPYLKFLPHSVSELKLCINVDGLPLFKSANNQVWPILFSIVGLPKKVFCAGMYHGDSKPENAANYMDEFIRELIDMINTGVQLDDGRYFKVSVFCVCCDAPAKSFLVGCKGHTAYSSCTRCTEIGEYVNGRVVFPDVNFTKRTHEDFLNRTDTAFHKLPSIFELVPGVDMVRSFCLDYLHLVCLGVMRKMLKVWVIGEVPLKLSASAIFRCSHQLINFRPFIPSEFCRKPRDLARIKRWKATELRQFLLYTGPVILKTALSDIKYQNFLVLSVAMRILLSPSLVAKTGFVQYARELLSNFVQSFKALYGVQFITHNFHNLLHLADDVEVFGSLELVSAFKFENYLQFVKSLVRKPGQVLSQVIRRMSEFNETEVPLKNCAPPEPKWRPLGDRSNQIFLFDDVCPPHYSVINHSGFKISSISRADSCVGTDGDNVIQVKGISYSPRRKCLVVVGQEFIRKEEFFKFPCKSSVVGVYKVKSMSTIKCWPLSEITKKYVLLPYKSEFVVLPLLHTDNQ